MIAESGLCQECGTYMPPSDTVTVHQHLGYCSEECLSLGMERKDEAYEAGKPYWRPGDPRRSCRFCGDDIPIPILELGWVYCSSDCQLSSIWVAPASLKAREAARSSEILSLEAQLKLD